jgi:hypothetical protein
MSLYYIDSAHPCVSTFELIIIDLLLFFESKVFSDVKLGVYFNPNVT